MQGTVYLKDKQGRVAQPSLSGDGITFGEGTFTGSAVAVPVHVHLSTLVLLVSAFVLLVSAFVLWISALVLWISTLVLWISALALFICTLMLCACARVLYV